MPAPNAFPAVIVANVCEIFQVYPTLAKDCLNSCEIRVNWSQDSHDTAMCEFWALAVTFVANYRGALK